METIIFATKNKGKIKEINAILADMDVNVISMEDAGITIDNKIKAHRWTAQFEALRKTTEKYVGV